MKKVLIIHGFEGSPNGGWRPWLMAELAKHDIYAGALCMPLPEAPVCEEWVAEIARVCEAFRDDELYLVGHSLGVPAILRYLESPAALSVSGAVLVSGPSEKNGNHKIDSFLEDPFAIEKIRECCPKFTVIHGDDDPRVPMTNAEYFAEHLEAELTVVPNGGHLNGKAGWYELPLAMRALEEMFA